MIAQTSDTTDYHYGIWQAFGSPLSPDVYPEVRGQLCGFRWRDIEIAPNQWNWASFDSTLAAFAQQNLPIIFMVYTKQDAPDWLYDNGVPKVIEKDISGTVTGFSPYYVDPDYKIFYERMITTVRQHIEALPDSIRRQIVAVQACLGSTGDYIDYKGNVDAQYRITATGFYDLFKEFSSYYYNEYKNTLPKIYLLSNPKNTGADQCAWLLQNCPKGWIKTGTLGKGYQLNDEVTKASWLYSIINNSQNGHYVRSRSEDIGSTSGITSGWWAECPYKNMFALMCYDIFWGLDWSNQGVNQIKDPLYDSAFGFYNKYAGQKIPSKSTNALCAFKDGLDAQDTVRFPVSAFGSATRNNKTRFSKILQLYAPYGAKLEDPSRAVLREADNLVATGINDVGWNIFPGNYERYLYQIAPNATSTGYWNIQSNDSNSMFGRFGRGFDVSKGKNALYFDVDSNFLKGAPLNSSYPVMINVIYLDKGYGSWQVFYDAQDLKDKPSIIVNCSNSGLWKNASITLKDAYFSNGCSNNSDFYIKSENNENVIFAMVELARPNAQLSDIGFSNTPITSFNNVCINTTSVPKSFSLTGAFLNDSTVVVGPLPGFTFSTSVDSLYSDSLVFRNYGASFTQ